MLKQKRQRVFFFIFFICLFFAKKDVWAATPSQSLTQLEKYLTVEGALLGVQENVSWYFKDLLSTNEISLDPTRSWIPASTIKSYVVLEAFRQRRLGMIDFDDPVTIVANNVVATELETDVLPKLREGVVVTIRQLIEAMITQSDNTAYNTLLDILDRRNINNTLREIGITETVVGEKLNLDDEQFQKDLQVPGRQANTTTVGDLATFFDFLYSQKIPEANEILAIFKRQKINSMIPAFLPKDTIIAHKTGDWAPIYHDGGIVYKPQKPFLLTIFTNSNDPSVVSQIARVAYYQNAQVVGMDAKAIDTKPTSEVQEEKVYSLGEDKLATTKVLGLTQIAESKFPKVTAEDLGITNKDLTIDREDIQKIPPAIIGPNSPWYPFKMWRERISALLPRGQSQRVTMDLEFARNRIADAKAVGKNGDLGILQKLIYESESNLAQASEIAQKNNLLGNQLLKIKQINDLHYALLSETMKTVTTTQKAALIDLVYDFRVKNQKEVIPIIKDSLVANPLKQEPIIGTVKEVKNGVATLTFDSGTEKQVVISPVTPMRDFHKNTLDTYVNFPIGDRVAVIGRVSDDGKILPTFILKNIPHELPDKHEGVILEINPKKRTLEIQTPEGKNETVNISSETILKAKDTSVSLSGLTVGSLITIFGEIKNPVISGKLSPDAMESLRERKTPSVSAELKSTELKPKSTTNPQASGMSTSANSATTNTAHEGSTNTTNSTSSNAPNNTSPSPQTTINATSVTVVKNSSGKDEKTEVKKSSENKTSSEKPESKKQDNKKTK